MHASSYENMMRCCESHVSGDFFDRRDFIVVADLGAADVNGGYRAIFSHPKFNYIGLDMAAGPGVDIVLSDPYRIPLADAHADLVISGQALEHSEFFWLSFAEMTRILKPDGFLFLIAPSAGPIHRYPVDCYRFYPDAYAALAKYAGCDLIETWLDDRGPWNDLVGVFRARGAPRLPRDRKSDEGPSWRPGLDPAAKTSGFNAPPEAETLQGAAGYLDVLRQIHQDLSPSLYLEIGVRNGDSLGLADCRAIAIDPLPQLPLPLSDDVRVVATTSDRFFAADATAMLRQEIDLAFIDGMHLFEFALRDFMNIERHASGGGVIVFDDIFPNHPMQAERERRSRAWTGDVWKIVPCLREYRPELVLLPIDASPAGLLLVAGLNPQDVQLRSQYNPIVRRFVLDGASSPPAAIFERADALSPNDARIGEILSLLRAARQERTDPAAQLRNWRQTAGL